jgi:transposase
MKKKPVDTVQFQRELPTILVTSAKPAQQAGLTAVKVFAQDETRIGLLPLVRHRLTACGVQPIAPVGHRFDNFYLVGAVEPLTGESFFLELPTLNTQTFQLWLEGFAHAFPDSLNILVLDNGAFHKAKALAWPANVVGCFLPPYTPELNPIERLWRDLKDKLSDLMAKSIEELSDTVCRLITEYSKLVHDVMNPDRYQLRMLRLFEQQLFDPARIVDLPLLEQ